MLLAGPIPHNSIHLLIITADFVALYRFYWICPFHYHFTFLPVLSLQTSVCSTLKFYPVFLES